jgi:hypothetical protein
MAEATEYKGINQDGGWNPVSGEFVFNGAVRADFGVDWTYGMGNIPRADTLQGTFAPAATEELPVAATGLAMQVSHASQA